MNTTRLFKIAHRSAKNSKSFNILENRFYTYRERFAQELSKQYRFEKEAIADGTIEERIKIQEILLAPVDPSLFTKKITFNSFLEELREKNNSNTITKELPKEEAKKAA